MKRLTLALIALFALSASVGAQNVPPGTNPVPGAGAYNSSPPICTSGQFCELQTDVNGQLKVAASVSASVTGFTPGLTFATLTATGSSASVALPAGATVAFQNTGTTTVSCTLGVGSATAVAGEIQVPASSTVFLTVGSNTFGACIDESGSVSNVVRLAGGAGLGTGFGGGGGGSGGGGAITAAINSYAAGALSAGAFAAGAGVDGWDLSQGAKADAVCGTATGTCSLIALMKYNNSTSPILGAGTATVGNTGTDPSSGKATPTFINLALPATTTTQIIALSGSLVTYVTSMRFMASGAVNLTLKYGTGSNCGTGTTTLDGPYPLAAQAGVAIGSGTGAILIVPAGKALCVTTDASMTGAVGMTYQQF